MATERITDKLLATQTTFTPQRNPSLEVFEVSILNIFTYVHYVCAAPKDNCIDMKEKCLVNYVNVGFRVHKCGFVK